MLAPLVCIDSSFFKRPKNAQTYFGHTPTCPRRGRTAWRCRAHHGSAACPPLPCARPPQWRQPPQRVCSAACRRSTLDRRPAQQQGSAFSRDVQVPLNSWGEPPIHVVTEHDNPSMSNNFQRTAGILSGQPLDHPRTPKFTGPRGLSSLTFRASCPSRRFTCQKHQPPSGLLQS